MPIAFPDLKADLELELRARQPDEYLLHPKWSLKRPLDPSALHLHFKNWLERAGLPATIKMHELRHSAADNLWREPGTCCSRNNSSGTNRSRPRRHTCIHHATTSPRRSPASKS